MRPHGEAEDRHGGQRDEQAVRRGLRSAAARLLDQHRDLAVRVGRALARGALEVGLAQALWDVLLLVHADPIEALRLPRGPTSRLAWGRSASACRGARVRAH